MNDESTVATANGTASDFPYGDVDDDRSSVGRGTGARRKPIIVPFVNVPLRVVLAALGFVLLIYCVVQIAIGKGDRIFPIGGASPASAETIVDPTAVLASRVDDLETQLNQALTDLAALKSDVDNRMVSGFDAVNTRISGLQSKVDNRPAAISKLSLKEIRSRAKIVTQRLAMLERKFKEHAAKARKTRKERQLPFALSSIDIWAGQPIAVVAEGDQLFALTAGEAQSGWTLTMADPLTGEATFRYRDGGTRVLRAQG